MTETTGWCILPPHVFPLSDYRVHIAVNCWCQPTETDGAILHHAMDQREEYEKGRKLS